MSTSSSTSNSSTSNLTVAIQQALAPSEGATPPTTVVPTGKAKVALGAFATVSHADLIVVSQSVLIGMTGNAAFPAPTPTLADLAAMRIAYIAAVNAAKDSRRQIVVRNQRRDSLVGMLRDLALYVQVASGGDKAILMSSGFTAQRIRQPIGVLPAPSNLRLKRGTNSGQIAARCNRLAQSRAYEWRYANATTPTVWIEIESTFAANTVIEGLAPGTQYIVQVRALATDGPSDWSDAAMMMVV